MVNVPIRSDDQADQSDQNQNNNSQGSNASDAPVAEDVNSNTEQVQGSTPPQPGLIQNQTPVDAPDPQVSPVADNSAVSQAEESKPSMDMPSEAPSDAPVEPANDPVTDNTSPSTADSSTSAATQSIPNENQEDARKKMEEASSKANAALDDMINSLSDSSSNSAAVTSDGQVSSDTDTPAEIPPVTQEIPEQNDAVQGTTPPDTSEKQQDTQNPPDQE